MGLNRDSVAIYKIGFKCNYWDLLGVMFVFLYNGDLMKSNCHLIMISLDLVDFLEFSEN